MAPIARILLIVAGAAALDAAALEPSDISGTVTGPKGPEAGVWVIAETTELPTRFARIVVTDEKGQFLIPDLPKASYSVWVRGYGLVDSPRVRANPGRALDLTAVPAPNEAAAAHYYPAIYWYAMLRLPKPEDFGGKGRIPENVTPREWMSSVKNIGCIGCHQLGQESTRTLPAAFSHIKSSEEAWMTRLMSGQSGQQMINQAGNRLGGAPFPYYAEWTDRVAKGELPFARPRRPEGPERNVVVTWWEWSQPERYLHDLVSSDRRDPTVNAYGPLYGSPEYSTDSMPILDPKTHKVTYFKLPVRDADTPESLGPGHAAAEKPLQPSPYWGDVKTWDTKANNHNAMFDRQGRVWLSATVRAPNNPDFCKKGSDHPSAKVAPLERNNRQVAFLDPKTMRYTFVDTCFGTHHLQFDAQDRLWTSGAPVAAWVDTKVFHETGDAAKAQRWMPFTLANGERLEGYGTYAVMPNPADGSVWYTARIFAGGGSLLRFDPQTGLSELFNVPAPGYAPRGADIDKHGVVWVSMGSGHMGSFDRRKCKAPLTGPQATGDHCPEGWSFHQYPGPGFRGIDDNSAESSYYTWVDQHNTLGLGEDVPVSTGNLNDGLIAYAGGKMIVLRVPYPMGFYAKGLDGRIDDATAGWKGRGLWTTSGDRTPWLREGGKGSLPIAVQFQYRPNPLAR
jgi:streptogramin lyase